MAWVAAEIREKFDQTVNRMGLEPQAVMNDIMWHVIHNQCLPSDIKTPNAETLEAFAERDLEAKTLEETFAEWDAEDAEDAKANRNDEQVQEGPSTRGGSGRHKELAADVQSVVRIPALDAELPDRFHDHKLHGDHADKRECHVKPDLLLIHSSSAHILEVPRSESEAGHPGT